MAESTWSVTVTVNGVEVLTIGHNWLSGIEHTPEQEHAIRQAGEHLLSFIGDAIEKSP